MAIPLIVLIVATVLLLSRWAWRAMKRSKDPAAQEAVNSFQAQLNELRRAVSRLVQAISHPK